MAIIPRGMGDQIIDKIKTALETFEAEQVLIDPNVFFNVVRDMIRPPSDSDLPLVNIWAESLDPQREGSSARLCQQELVRINIDCYTKGLSMSDVGIDDGVAMARLYYLAEQVKYGLYRLINADFGMSAGIIAKKPWPRWSIFQSELKLPETEVVAGRWVIELTYQWTPEDIAGDILDEIAVDTGIWAATYHYGGD